MRFGHPPLGWQHSKCWRSTDGVKEQASTLWSSLMSTTLRRLNYCKPTSERVNEHLRNTHVHELDSAAPTCERSTRVIALRSFGALWIAKLPCPLGYDRVEQRRFLALPGEASVFVPGYSSR